MGRFISLRLSAGYVLVFSVTVFLLILVGLPFVPDEAQWWWLPAGAAAIALVPMIAFRGLTIPDRWRVRRNSAAPLSAAMVHSRDRAGVVWDGATASVLMEVAPTGPFPVTWVSDTDDIDRTPIPLELLASLLVQLDIHCSEIAVLGIGYRTVLEEHKPSQIGEAVLGNMSWPTSGRTFVQVSMKANRSLGSVFLRARSGSVPLGRDRAILMAAARVRAQLAHHGFAVKLLPVSRVEAVTDEVLSVTGKSVDNPHSGWSGVKGGVQTVSATVAGSWDEDKHRRWVSRSAYRTYERLSLTPGRTGPEARYTVTFASRDRGMFSGLWMLGLSTIKHQQRPVLASLAPLAATGPVELPGVAVDKARIELYPGGLGVLVGSSADKGRLFIRIDPDAGQTLYLVGPDELARQFLLRLILTLVTVDVRLGQPGGEWDRFVRRLSSRLVTFRSNWTPGIVVCDEREVSAERVAHPGRTIIAVCSAVPEHRPEHSIIADRDRLVVTTGTDQAVVTWRMDPRERDFIRQR